MKGGTEDEIWEAAEEIGCKTLMDCGLWRVSEGLTTLDEVLKVALKE